jgi:hypothetical protein
VLILEDLLSPVLILLDFKSFIISDLIKNEGFAEVLILGGLGRAVGMDGWRRAGGTRHVDSSRGAELLRGRAAWKWCSGRMPHRSTKGYSMSIYIYRLVFECL